MSEVVHPPESIYNLLPKQEVHISKPSRYVSKYRSAVVLETKANKDPMRTMGPAKVEVPSPDKYLRKHSKEPRSPDKMQISQRHACTVKKPPVPARTDNPPMGIHTKKNFIRTAIFVTVKPKPAIVDTNKGHKQLLDNSGLAPKYTKKKDYGKVPGYLQQRKEEELRVQEEYENFLIEQREQEAIKLPPEERRQAALEGLKKTWEQLHHEYQCLPLIIDTMQQKYHKQRLEAKMTQVEKDMNVLEKFKGTSVPNE